MMTTPKPSTMLKPSLSTQFHIDYGWWERAEEDLRPYLMTHLPAEKRTQFQEGIPDQIVDYVDPKTAEVTRLDALGLALKEAASHPDFINPHTSLVDSVFRVFLMNGNMPQTPLELAEITGRDANTILKTLGGFKVYKGIRPYSSQP